MSKQPAIDPLSHIHALGAALRLPDQPMATFRALDAAMDAVIGHTYITILLYHADLQEIERLYAVISTPIRLPAVRTCRTAPGPRSY